MQQTIRSWRKRPYDIAIALMMLWVVVINFQHRHWMGERVIEWDVKSYYAYLPAAFIYQDLSLEFRRENLEKFGDLIWPVTTPTGKQAIVTSMGMSILYSPFFFIAHGVAQITPWEADGYSPPYRFALNFSTLFYVLMGLIFLKKVLLRWFTPWVTTFTLVAVFAGTNLLYYTTYEAAMSHGFNFALIAVFLYYTIRWYDAPGSAKRIAWLGLLAGFITLVRPTNIIVLILFFLWGVDSWNAFRERFMYFIRRPALVGIMAGCFVLAWVPQFIYWKYISGMFFYFSYGELGGSFFWHNPQIMNILFSYKKGWFVYTPLMFFAFLGIFLLPWKLRGAFLPILLFKLVNIYILSSWWAWWFGGGFGLRAFIDSYAIMAIPFATLVTALSRQRRLVSYPTIGLLAVLIWFAYFQMRQYRSGAIHWWWMNKEAYWETFLKRRPTQRYWDLITIPDYELARQGIYVAIKPDPPKERPREVTVDQERLRSFIMEVLAQDSLTQDVIESQELFEQDAQQAWIESQTARILQDQEKSYFFAREYLIRAIEHNMRLDPQMQEFIEKKAREQGVPVDTMFRRDAVWVYENQRH
jgi:hypothetical protein